MPNIPALAWAFIIIIAIFVIKVAASLVPYILGAVFLYYLFDLFTSDYDSY